MICGGVWPSLQGLGVAVLYGAAVGLGWALAAQAIALVGAWLRK